MLNYQRVCGDMLEIVSNQLRKNLDQLTWDIEKPARHHLGICWRYFQWDLHISNNQETWIQMIHTFTEFYGTFPYGDDWPHLVNQ